MHRKIMGVLFGLAVIALSFFGIAASSGGAFLVVSVIGIAALTLLLIFGIEVNRIEVGDRIVIDFSDE